MLQVQQPQVLQMPAPVMTSGVQGLGARHSCPPEIFQKLAAGGALTQEEVAQITGQMQVAPAEGVAAGAAGAVGGAINSVGSAAAAIPGQLGGAAAGATGAADTVGSAAQAVTGSAKASKKKDAKKSLKASKKTKSKGCC